MALIGQGKSQYYWLKYDSRNFFKRAGSDSRIAMQASSSVPEAGILVQSSP